MPVADNKRNLRVYESTPGPKPLPKPLPVKPLDDRGYWNTDYVQGEEHISSK